MTKKKVSDNGKVISADQAIKNAKIEFPVTFDLKAVLNTSNPDDVNMGNLSLVFSKLKVSNTYIGNKKSSKGTYVSYNYKVTLENKLQLDKLYSDLKNVPGLKFAL